MVVALIPVVIEPEIAQDREMGSGSAPAIIITVAVHLFLALVILAASLVETMRVRPNHFDLCMRAG